MEQLTSISESIAKYPKSGKSKYSDFYTRYFTCRKPKILLEIGVYKGDSLRIWQDVFSGCKVLGLDIDPEAAQLNPEFKIYTGDQKNILLLDQILDENGPLDIVIDDGGHTRSQQITTLNYLFPKLLSGSLYIIEDLQVNSLQSWNDQPLSTYTHLINIAQKPKLLPHRSIIFEPTICLLMR